MIFRYLSPRLRIQVSLFDWHLIPWYGRESSWAVQAIGWLCIAFVYERPVGDNQ